MHLICLRKASPKRYQSCCTTSKPQQSHPLWNRFLSRYSFIPIVCLWNTSPYFILLKENSSLSRWIIYRKYSVHYSLNEQWWSSLVVQNIKSKYKIIIKTLSLYHYSPTWIFFGDFDFKIIVKLSGKRHTPLLSSMSPISGMEVSRSLFWRGL